MPSYKKLKSVAHNFADSFLSSMNYVDDEYVEFEIKREFLNSGLEKATFDFLDFGKSDKVLKTKRVSKSWGFYGPMLKKQFESQGCTIDQVVSFKLSIIKSKVGLFYEAEIVDDRGKTTTIGVNR